MKELTIELKQILPISYRHSHTKTGTCVLVKSHVTQQTCTNNYIAKVVSEPAFYKDSTPPAYTAFWEFKDDTKVNTNVEQCVMLCRVSK